MKELQIGDVVYREGTYREISRGKIDRVTAKRAYSGKSGYIREYSDSGYINEYPASRGYCSYRTSIATEKLDQKYRRAVLVQYIDRLKTKDMSTECMSQIKMLVEEMKCETKEVE